MLCANNKGQHFQIREKATKELTLVGVSPPLGVRLGPVHNRKAELSKDVRRLVQLGCAVPNGLGLGHDAVCPRRLFDLGFSLAREPARLAESVALGSGERILDRDEISQQLNVRPVAGTEQPRKDQLELRGKFRQLGVTCEYCKRSIFTSTWRRTPRASNTRSKLPLRLAPLGRATIASCRGDRTER